MKGDNVVYTGPLTKEQYQAEKVIMDAIGSNNRLRIGRRFKKLNSMQTIARKVQRRLSEEDVLKEHYQQ